MDNISSNNYDKGKTESNISFIDKLGNNEQSIKIKQFYHHPNFIFHKKKPNYENYTSNTFNEESPTFSFENDKNVKSYKSYILNKSKEIDKYSQNYIYYMRNLFNGKNLKYTLTQNKSINNNLNDNNNNNNYSGKTSLSISKSYSNINKINENVFIMKGRTNEITNPDLYFKQENPEYLKYKEEQKKYLNYNFQKILNNNLFKKREVNVNPFNKGSSRDILGTSFLKYNPIIDPTPQFGYNKYFERELDKNIKINNRNNSNNINILQKAGNNFIIG